MDANQIELLLRTVESKCTRDEIEASCVRYRALCDAQQQNDATSCTHSILHSRIFARWMKSVHGIDRNQVLDHFRTDSASAKRVDVLSEIQSAFSPLQSNI